MLNVNTSKGFAFGLLGGLVLAAIFYATVSDGLPSWWQHEGILVSSKDTLAGWITALIGVVATAISAWAVVLLRQTLLQTVAATEAAQAAVSETRRIGEAQVRAYLANINVLVEDFSLGSVPVYRVSVKNTGQSPARGVRISLAIRTGASPADRVRFRNLKYMKLVDVPAGESAPQEIIGNSPILAETYANIISGRACIVLGGVFRYRDVFGKRHFTVFRYALDPRFPEPNGSFKMTVCSRNNAAN
jgi:hypothetical protein